MTMVVVDANGEVTLRKALLESAGARAGDTLEVEVRVVSPSQGDRKPIDWDAISGRLKIPPGTPPLSIDEMDALIAKGWAGELDDRD
ncbi:hypothetical protein [Brevundimonas sp.]|uniref:hypothetical protein n=1 Tax=Brevundimonas sp. TaxID=1871086 RepID=UPI002625B4D7|nr:hypothetical protein [Brevundimonas sp.]